MTSCFGCRLFIGWSQVQVLHGRPPQSAFATASCRRQIVAPPALRCPASTILTPAMLLDAVQHPLFLAARLAGSHPREPACSTMTTLAQPQWSCATPSPKATATRAAHRSISNGIDEVENAIATV